MAVDTQLGETLITSGVFDYINGIRFYASSEGQTADALVNSPTWGRGLNYDTAFWISELYWDSQRAGRAIQRRRSDTLADTGLIPSVPGCVGSWEYTVVFRMQRGASGQTRSYPVTVSADRPIGKLTILDYAAQALERELVDNDTLFAATGSGEQWQQIGEGRVTAAMQCT